jgi:hypothetical protein
MAREILERLAQVQKAHDALPRPRRLTIALAEATVAA